jgi:uncharacterized damage-inducible protein DinB
VLRGIVGGLALLAGVAGAQDFKAEYLAELKQAGRQVASLAAAIPAEKFAWRPGAGVRSFGEVCVHIGAGDFLLLDIVGHKPPADLYGAIEGGGMVKRNRELEKIVVEKEKAIELMKRSLAAAAEAFEKTGDFDATVSFFGQKRTVRAVYLRLLVHLNEHLGQLVAYARTNGVAPPWARTPGP